MPEATTLNVAKLAAARLRAAQAQPFLGVALYALTPCSSPGLGTFAVDERWRLFIDPASLEEWSVAEVAGVLLHEIGHIVRCHADRARASFVDSTTHDLWNLAGDAEINDDLLSDQVALPGKPVTPAMLSAPRGKAAEFYYQRLLTRSHPHLPEVNCGSGSHGVSPTPDEESGLLPAGVAKDEADLIRRRVALAILAARRAGTMAGGWSRWAEGWLTPTVDWRRVFAATIRGSLNAYVSGQSNYLYSRPSRRRVPGVILPGLVRPVVTVAAIIDTSASVNNAGLASAWSEVLEMMRAVGVRRDRLRLWSADTEAHRIRGTTSPRVELIGGGGTNMAIAIDSALGERPMVDLVVVLTDGETPWPRRKPRRPVVVGLMCEDSSAAIAHVPSWATTVRIPLDETAHASGR